MLATNRKTFILESLVQEARHDQEINKPKMAYSRDAFIETREDREGLERERESGGTIDRLYKDWQDTIHGAMADGLS